MKNHFRMVKLLDHPQIIEYTDFHFDEGKRTMFVVMEFCEEADLRS
jgi:serine/threonine protein kinase